MAEVGRPLDPWQADIVVDAHGVRDDGLWAAYELLVLVARQNGKGGVTEAIELGGLFLFREPVILHSAHEFKTSGEAFRRVVDVIDGSDWLTRRVKSVSRSKGQEGIELTRAAGGGRLLFVARTAGSGRGFTGSKNVFDEAYALTVAQFAAQTPTLATIPNPQIIYTSTPPDEDTGPLPVDAMLPSVRRRARGGADRVGYYEWSPPEKFDRRDVEVMYATNPAAGIRITIGFLQNQLAAFEAAGRPQKFDTEHLGYFPPDEDEQWLVIPEGDWLAVGEPTSLPDGPVAFGLEVDHDRMSAAIGVAWHRPDGLRQVELTRDLDGLVDYRPGTGWCVTRAKALADKWPGSVLVVDKNSPAGSLLPELEAAGVPLATMGAPDAGRAFGDFFDAVAGRDFAARNVRHGNQDELTAAVAGGVERRLGDARAWDRKVSRRFAPLGAVTAALWGLHELPEPYSAPNIF